MNKKRLKKIITVLSLVVTFQAIFISYNLKDGLKVAEELPVEVKREIESQAKKEISNFQQKNDEKIDKKVSVWLSKKEDVLDPNYFDIEIWMNGIIPVSLVDLKINYKNLKIIDQDLDKYGTQIAYGEANRYLENKVNETEGKILLAADFKNGFRGKILLGKIKVKKINDYWNSEIEISLNEENKDESYVISNVNKDENVLKVSSKLTF